MQVIYLGGDKEKALFGAFGHSLGVNVSKIFWKWHLKSLDIDAIR